MVVITPRFTFGLIVLNGEPFTRYTLRALYPHAFEIIVVEGAAPAARNIAAADGHSRDGTLDVLRRFKNEEDHAGKIRVIVAEDEGHPNGFWPGEKDEQSQAYARRASGDYLWQVDIDEFYLAEDIERVRERLRSNPPIDSMSFRQINFWGALDYEVDGWYLRRGGSNFHRLFKWGPGYTYSSHRPPTVLDAEGRDLRNGNWLDADTTARIGIRLFHYSLLFPRQVLDKCEYYTQASWARSDGALDWAKNAFFDLARPFRVHNVYVQPSWLQRYRGSHPDQVLRMMADVSAEAPYRLRSTADVERLLDSRRYRLGRSALKILGPAEERFRPAASAMKHQLRRLRRLLVRWPRL